MKKTAKTNNVNIIRMRKQWCTVRIYANGDKKGENYPAKKYDPALPRSLAQEAFKKEENCIAFYAFYVKSFLFSKRLGIWTNGQAIYINRNGLEF